MPFSLKAFSTFPFSSCSCPLEFKAQLLVKGLYAAALGIEILCITAAEIGENTGLYLFGFNPWNSYRICYGIHPC
jgi:hypothetical protein